MKSLLTLICGFGLGIGLLDRLPRRANAQDAPATTQSARATDEPLDWLHDAGKGLKAFTSTVSLNEKDTTTGDDFTRLGKVWYQVKGNGDARLRVLFETKIVDDKPRADKVEYVLDDGWLTDRAYRTQKETRRQVLRPGQKINLLKLGEGPFPLPIGQDKQDVYQEFDVSLTPSGETDPGIHLTLTPKETSKFSRKFKQIDVWVDAATKFPVRIDTLDRNEAISRSTLLKITPAPEMAAADFALEPVTGWKTFVEPFEE